LRASRYTQDVLPSEYMAESQVTQVLADVQMKVPGTQGRRGVVATDVLPAFFTEDKVIAVDAVFLLLALLWAATEVEDCLMLEAADEAAEDLAVVFKVVGTWVDDEAAAEDFLRLSSVTKILVSHSKRCGCVTDASLTSGPGRGYTGSSPSVVTQVLIPGRLAFQMKGRASKLDVSRLDAVEPSMETVAQFIEKSISVRRIRRNGKVVSRCQGTSSNHRLDDSERCAIVIRERKLTRTTTMDGTTGNGHVVSGTSRGKFEPSLFNGDVMLYACDASERSVPVTRTDRDDFEPGMIDVVSTFSSSLTRSLKQGTLKGHGKTAFPIRNRWLSEGVQIKAVTNEAVAGDSCIAVQSSMTMNLVTNTFESFSYACHSHDGLFFLRAKTRRKEACFKGGG
ncbi:hypothetical protein KCU62_g460, partial [Aureobasidium sp. EXF-3399]